MNKKGMILDVRGLWFMGREFVRLDKFIEVIMK